MAGFKNSYGVEVNFTPWFDSGFRLSYLKMYEELGGELGKGSMRMEFDPDKGSCLDMINNLRTGTISIGREGRSQYPSIQIFITKMIPYKNFAEIEFVCIDDKSKFVEKRKCFEYQMKIKDVIESHWGAVDWRTNEPDVSDPKDYYQDNETEQQFVARLLYSYKWDTIFTFGWEGCMLKEICGDKNSKGNNEGSDSNKLEIRSDSELQQLDNYEFRYKPENYREMYNCWTQGPPDEMKDYSEWHPVNFVPYYKYGLHRTVHPDYADLEANYVHNRNYMETEFFHQFRVTVQDVPDYKIGDVLLYFREAWIHKGKLPPDWNSYARYLVKSNEVFYALDGSPYVDEEGNYFSWTSKLMSLEENGSWAVDKTSDTW